MFKPVRPALQKPLSSAAMKLIPLVALTLETILTSAFASAQASHHPDMASADLLADAQTRTSLFAGSPHSTGGPGLELVSPDGSARVKFSEQFQFRYILNHRQRTENVGLDDDDTGFEFRRMRLKAAGSVLDGAVPFTVKGGFGSTGTLKLVDSWFGYIPSEGIRIRIGQFTAPFTRESIISSSKLVGVDYALANAVFTVDRSQGIEYRVQNEKWSASIMLGEGAKDLNTPYTVDADWGITARTEHLFGGSWKRFKDYVGRPGDDLALLLGGAVHLSGGETDSDGDGFTNDTFYDARVTADASLEGNGFNAMLAIYGQQLSTQGIPDTSRWGFTLQGGVFLSEDTDIFAQYAFADDDGDLGTLSVATVGTTWYIVSHDVILTTDVNYAFEPITPAINSSSRGFRPDASVEDGQIVVRSQFQIIF